MRISKSVPLGLLLACAAAALPVAPALGAPDPVCGAVLTHSVKLKANMECNMSATSGLVIGKDGITVDLNHHLIDGPGYNAGFFSGVDNTDGFANVTVKNGTLQLYRFGVLIENASDNTVRGVHVKLEQVFTNIGLESDYSVGTRFLNNNVSDAGDGTALYNYYSVESLFAGNKVTNSDLAIYEDSGTKNRFVNNSKTDVDATAVGVDDTSGSYKDVYEGNVFKNGKTGFLFDSPRDAKVIGNTASNNAEAGFEFDNLFSPASLTASDNTANNNGTYGFYAGYPALGSHNHAHGNAFGNCVGVRCD